MGVLVINSYILVCLIYLQDSQSGNEEEGQGKKGGRVRSLSTGSINKPMSPEQVEVELETNALLLSDQPKPRPRKVRFYSVPRILLIIGIDCEYSNIVDSSWGCGRARGIFTVSPLSLA